MKVLPYKALLPSLNSWVYVWSTDEEGARQIIQERGFPVTELRAPEDYIYDDLFGEGLEYAGSVTARKTGEQNV
ncbi:MAG: hypothetical protein LRZ94_01190 [Candidatus Pacebacteria bacterium]|nr:hypothetical protein [Candidatus Paceibacterota bacterium]